MDDTENPEQLCPLCRLRPVEVSLTGSGEVCWECAMDRPLEILPRDVRRELTGDTRVWVTT